MTDRETSLQAELDRTQQELESIRALLRQHEQSDTIPPPVDHDLLMQIAREVSEHTRRFDDIDTRLTLIANEVRRHGQCIAAATLIPPPAESEAG
jgi:hypothetical protein